jgi:TonB-dependent receptor-like protein
VLRPQKQWKHCWKTWSRRRLVPLAILSVLGGGITRAQNSVSSPSGGKADSQSAKQSDATATAPRRGAELIREDQLVGLPLNGRSYSSLATLQTGVSDTGAANASRGVGGGNLSVAGGRNTSNIYLTDGTNIQNSSNQAPRSAAGVQLGSDAVLQVQVFATTYSAEYGRGTGGVLNSITRSGGDKFHGTVFEFWRNSKLDAKNFFDVQDKPPFKRNQFGGLFSGPLRKGKTYFMGSFEAMRDRLTDTDISFAPTTEARTAGILRDCDFKGQVKQVPIHPSMVDYLKLYTPANGAERSCGVAETIGAGFQPVDENFYVVRVDHQLTERTSTFVRYSFDDANSTSRGALFAFENLNATRQQYLTLVTSHIFSPRTVGSLRLGYTRPTNNQRDNSHQVEIPKNLYFVPDALQFGIIHVDGLTDFGPSDGQPQSNKMNSFQYDADMVLQRGPHSVKFGGQVHRYRWDDFTNTSRWGTWGFNSVESLLQAGPEATTNLTVALPGAATHTAYRQTVTGLYIQDNVRWNSQLDVSLGVRYELATKVHEKDGRSAALVDIVHDTTPLTGSLMKDNPTVASFSPRVGLTWAPWRNHDTLISAGFGIFHDQILYYLIDPVKNTTPYYQVAVLTNIKAQGIFPRALDATQQGNFRLSTKTLDYNHIQLPSVLRYHFTVQQPFYGWTLRAGYVGTRGNHLMRGYEANQFSPPHKLADGTWCFPPDAASVRPQDINPDCPPVTGAAAGPVNQAFNSIEQYSTDAQSFYNSLQVAVNRSPVRGMSVQFSYTWSKSVDDASGLTPGDLQYGFDRLLDRGLSSGDQRHRIAVNYFLTSPNHLGSPLVSTLFRRWRLGGIVSWRTGTPFSAKNSVRRPGYLFSAARANLNPGFSNNPTSGMSAGCNDTNGRRNLPPREVGDARYYFDPCAFGLPAPGLVGNAGRNTIISPNVFSMDVSLQRDFVLGGEKRLQFRVEMFNVPNHPSLSGPPNGSQFVFTGSSGNSNSRIGQITRTATTSRQLQFATRLSF